MEYFRCRICGEVYMGEAAPTHCPYCGAAGNYLVAASDWTDENTTIGDLSALSRANLEKAEQLEVNNSLFYREASWHARTNELQGIFKYLSKIEKEHISIIGKVLKHEPPPDPSDDREIASEDDTENLRMAKAIEEKAAAFYAQAAGQAVETRVKTVFTALAEVESGHISEEGRLLGG